MFCLNKVCRTSHTIRSSLKKRAFAMISITTKLSPAKIWKKKLVVFTTNPIGPCDGPFTNLPLMGQRGFNYEKFINETNKGRWNWTIAYEGQNLRRFHFAIPLNQFWLFPTYICQIPHWTFLCYHSLRIIGWQGIYFISFFFSVHVRHIHVFHPHNLTCIRFHY